MVQYLHFVYQKDSFWVLIELTSAMDPSRESGDSTASSFLPTTLSGPSGHRVRVFFGKVYYFVHNLIS